MKMTQSEKLGQMDIKKLLFSLSVPAIIAMFANAMYNLVDTIFVAWGAGEIAIGALSIAFPIQMIVMAIGLMIGIGSSSIFSRAFGRKDYESMKRSVNTALIYNLILTLAMSVFGLIFIDELLYFFGATASNFDYAKEYSVIILWGLIPYSSAVVLNNLARAEGRAKVAMISLLIGALVNILLDPIFIFDQFLGLGVSGAAIATVIAKVASFVYIFGQSFSKKSVLNIDLKSLYKIDLGMVKDITAIGVPTFLRNTLGAFLVIIVNQLINQYASGDPAIYISIYGVINRMIMFMLMPGFGIVQGLTPIVGFNYGAKQFHRLHYSITLATKWVMLFFGFAFIMTLIFANQLFMLFSKEGDPYFITTGAHALRLVAVGFSVIAYQIVMSSVYQAMGFPVKAFLISLSRQFLFFIPLVYLFSYFMGIEGIWLTFLVSDVLAGTLSYVVYRMELKRIVKHPNYQTLNLEPN